MGEVWRATDTRLGRSVAVKILPAELSANAMLRARFEREAKTISQLGHPNICSLFDVGDNYLVMELLEGETLADRVVRGPLPMPAVLEIGAQIADALERAHRAGVVHRDLKPGNVMLTKSGAKLLDFGLAKSGGLQSIDPNMLTEAKPLTQEGSIVGTFQYMAPEQLEGLDADARTDIFALGCVLYEMATGRRAFQGTSKTSLIAAIVGSEPTPISAIQPLTPPAFEHVVQKCLAKERDARWQSAHDIAEELRWISQAGSQAGVAGPVVAKRRQRERLNWALAMLAVAAVAGAAAWFGAARWTKSHERAPLYRLTIATPPGSVLGYGAGRPALSPDGRLLAYASYTREGFALLVRDLADPAWRTLAGTTGAISPFWSPDSRQIGYFARGSLWKVAADGSGTPEEIARLQPGFPKEGTWGPDGTIVFESGRLYRVNASGGEPIELHLFPDKATVIGVELLPDGKHFLCSVADFAAGNAKHFVASLTSGEAPKQLVRGENSASYADGHLFFVRAGTLYAQPFDARALALSGEPKAITKVQSFPVEMAYFTVAGDTLVYLPQGSEVRTELRRVDRTGKPLGTIGPQAFFFSPRISHDGTRVAVDESATSGEGDIWILDVATGASTRVSFAPQNESGPNWGPGDADILYFGSSFAQGKGVLLRKTLRGAQPSTVFESTLLYTGDWSADGKTVLACMTDRVGDPMQVVALSVGDWKATPLGVKATAPHFSPDGKWFAYCADESGGRSRNEEIFVQPFPPNGSKWQISGDGGTMPVWRRDGKALYYVDAAGRMMESAVSVGADGGFTSQAPQPLFSTALREGAGVFSQYDLFPDGTFLLNRIPDTATTPLTVVLHWKQALAH